MDSLGLLRGENVHAGLNDRLKHFNFLLACVLTVKQSLNIHLFKVMRIARRLEVRKSLDLTVIFALGCLERSKGCSSTEKWSDSPKEGR